jgi:phenylalanyl-tRNA synthetase beta chain
MKFPVAWIRDYVELPSDEEAVARAFTLSGTEVEGTETVEGGTVFDFNVTVNRPDCMNVYGLAREASVLLGRPLKTPDARCAETGPPAPDLCSVSVEATDLCPRYMARVITGVKVRPSPAWMRKRLIQCGLRPINGVVDATNYVLLELGHPLHAFDLGKLEKRRIVVRRARPGEKIRTLDGVDRTLDPERLVIADGARPVALAGVMGGEESGVTESTAEVLLEGAVFDPVNVRRTSKALGIHTDSSHRFERGVDFYGPERALDRCAKLILEICGGALARGAVDAGLPPPAPKEVLLRPARLSALLGMEVDPSRALAILTSLGFTPVEGKDPAVWRLKVPSFRVDVSREADLVEEVVRVHGLQDLPSALPAMVDPVGGRPAELELEETLRDAFAACGFREAIHLSMTDPDLARRLAPAAEPLRLSNPLAPATSALRTTLLAPLLLSVARNRARGARRLALFELGRAYFGAEGERPWEESRLALVLYGDDPDSYWGAPPRPTFARLRGALEAAFEKAGLREGFVPGEHPAFAPGLCLAVLVEGRSVGHLGVVRAAALEAAGLKGGTALAAEVVLDGLEAFRRDPKFRPWSKFPAVVRDFSFLVDKAVRWGDLLAGLQGAGLAELQEVRLVDTYEGKGVPDGQRSWTFSLIFQSPERTLTEEDIAPVAPRVTEALQAAFGATLR